MVCPLIPTLLPEGERSEGAEGGLNLPLPLGEGQRVRERSRMFK